MRLHPQLSLTLSSFCPSTMLVHAPFFVAHSSVSYASFFTFSAVLVVHCGKRRPLLKMVHQSFAVWTISTNERLVMNVLTISTRFKLFPRNQSKQSLTKFHRFFDDLNHFQFHFNWPSRTPKFISLPFTQLWTLVCRSLTFAHLPFCFCFCSSSSPFLCYLCRLSSLTFLPVSFAHFAGGPSLSLSSVHAGNAKPLKHSSSSLFLFLSLSRSLSTQPTNSFPTLSPSVSCALFLSVVCARNADAQTDANRTLNEQRSTDSQLKSRTNRRLICAPLTNFNLDLGIPKFRRSCPERCKTLLSTRIERISSNEKKKTKTKK
jgi:hypothetical protein